PRLALLRPDRSIDLHHQPVRLALWRLEHRDRGSRYCFRFYRPLDHFWRRARLGCKRGLDVLDHGFKLLVRQVLERIAVLDLVLAGHQQREDFEVGRRVLTRGLVNPLFAVLTEVQQQRLDEFALAAARAPRAAKRWYS